MSSTTDKTARRHRIEMRVTAEQEALIRHAASLADQFYAALDDDPAIVVPELVELFGPSRCRGVEPARAAP